ncbi:MAG: hypothetical protein ACREXM_18940 [Gammaproteobacteria bacterium]
MINRRIVLVGDRGMMTEARIREELKPLEGVDWITALRAPAIRALVEAKAIQLSIFDAQDLAEITTSAYPAERLIVCKNRLLAEARAQQRESLLQATERELKSDRRRYPKRPTCLERSSADRAAGGQSHRPIQEG